ncbi:related to putidaredoxin reductase [Ramularia collo-cygni]|uniref:Related to putidaredoxin reductase n=1 Tax=Ramularia collo-cygni TaxID=112498 RepID=A0A2D3V3T0_9PEZI|nr:related to putidaredoxin reductase [Ramularia collo-cygni]CZT16159.1 related to putidaredoxin reductase [Ramularia collo-cygni]
MLLPRLSHQIITKSTRQFLPAINKSTAFGSNNIRSMTTAFKLKDISSLSDLKNGEKKEVEVEGLEKVKILLARHDNTTHALSPKCTHYGAPLAKGVLTASGRLTCPWHGACFNVKTGDIEDAPALDPLRKYTVEEKDGAVWVTGTSEAQLKENWKNLSIKCKSTEKKEKVVIVGGGSGAVGAIEGLRGGGFTGEIVCVLGDEGHLPIDRTKLSKGLVNDAKKVEWRSEEFYKEGGVELVRGLATGVDVQAKKVSTDSGKDIEYTKLILATGGIPRMLPLEGLKGDLGNVFPLRSVSDVQAILKAAGEDGGKKVVVIGSSFIGMEVGNALAGKKHNVSIIGMESEPMERVMGTQVGAVFRKLLEKTGVKFHMSASVEKGTGKDGKISSVSLKDGTSLPADLVIEGVGVRPATDFLKDNSAFSLEKDGSLSVDESFAVKGQKDIFAIGDIATYPYHGPGGNGKPVRIEHWNVAQNAGRSVAGTINDPSSKPKPFIPVFWSAVGAQLRYCGHTPEGFDDVIVQGTTDVSEGKQSFVAYYTRGEDVIAVASMMKDPYMVQSAELMRTGRMPGKSEINKGVDVMQVSLVEA